ncbi:MAG: glycoside hydrolase family 18 protein [bacterium]|nr:glycoside hydrolase family 18 protein [bacterium]
MKLLHTLTKPPWRTLVGSAIVIAVFLIGYQLWTPGALFSDGSYDTKRNGIWLQHGWLGDDGWFSRYNKDSAKFRDVAKIMTLRKTLLEHHISDLYPHLCPSRENGEVAAVDPAQTRLFLQIMNDFRVMPWVGGVLDVHVFPEAQQWRMRFVNSIQALFRRYPTFAGIHLNIEPLPSGNRAYLTLLQEIQAILPEGKLLSVAAYPPPTIFQRSLDVHWKEEYYRQVAKEVDQMVVMMYDTSLRYQKLYQQLMASWTQEVLDWSGSTEVLLGIPAYNDEGVKYHYPHVENLSNSLQGIYAGLERYTSPPDNYQGIAIYSGWEMEQEEWDFLKNAYLKNYKD